MTNALNRTRTAPGPRRDPAPALAVTLDPETCRRARLSRDARFDGEFYLGVQTTGIYCRPICPALVGCLLTPPTTSRVATNSFVWA